MADSQRKTANLFDKSTWNGVTAQRGTIEAVTNGFKLTATSDDCYSQTYASFSPSCSYAVTSGETYTLSWNIDNPNIYGNVFVFSGAAVASTVLTSVTASSKKVTVTIPSGHKYVAFRIGVAYSGDSLIYTNIMLNTGSQLLPYEPYGWVHSLRKLTTATDTITTLPVDIYTDGQTIGVNLLNTTDTQQTFPAGTYYIYSDSPDANIAYYDNVGEYPTIYGVAGTGNVFTATTSLVVQASLSSLPKGMVAKSSTEVPFQPYSNCTIIGNMVQTGTPTPQNPITPQETGDKTGNLLNTNGAQSGYISANGSITQGHDNLMYTDYLPIPDGAEYITQSSTYTMQSPALCFYDATKTYISGEAFSGATTKTFIVPTNAKYIRTSYRSGSSFGNTMLNSGSTPLSYEPYGYKLTISSANTTTPVYLGQVETVRQIKKVVLDGTESWEDVSIPSQDTYRYRINISDTAKDGSIVTAICSHYIYYYGSAGVGFNIGSGGGQLYIRDANCATDTDFKTYLTQQYAAGTPVTVWYVLAESTTGIVNEPLRKIGNYADTVSGITIPTITGKDTFDVQTTLKPSEVSLTYTGWHDASAKEWDGSEWE